MDMDFEKRLAKLDAKAGPGPAYTPPTPQHLRVIHPEDAPTARRGTSRTRLIAYGAIWLLGLPVLAGFAALNVPLILGASSSEVAIATPVDATKQEVFTTVRHGKLPTISGISDPVIASEFEKGAPLNRSVLVRPDALHAMDAAID